ncbi:hypothetical protein PVAP13_5NG230329 [Panicum virgatum]|uniref:Uncharacterized protein n=1 Tax=Panicum virgatum TaxID=38727 RepID=A0A8T0RV78_PANVG|nr:hypothetical protein PVAP13_5NG230329 [Panicum virgatum]
MEGRKMQNGALVLLSLLVLGVLFHSCDTYFGVS